jgi:hypothetical protein
MRWFEHFQITKVALQFTVMVMDSTFENVGLYLRNQNAIYFLLIGRTQTTTVYRTLNE